MSHEFDEYDFLAAKNLKQPTLTDKLWVTAVLSSLPAMCLWWVPKYYFGGRERSLSGYLRGEVGKFVYNRTTLEQLRFVIPPQPLRLALETQPLKRIGEAYPGYNKYFKVQGASARWLVEVEDRQLEDPVVLYLHGGAYFLTTFPRQVTWCLSMSKRVPRLSVLELDYTVAPNAMYPTQLNEAVATYLELQKTSRKIIILGDSAGGHLAATLCKHLSDNGQAQPHGVVLLSPWVELWPRYEGSYRDNKNVDYLSLGETPALQFCTREQIEDPYSNPARGDAQFWAGVFGPRTLSVWGEREVLRDTCAEFSAVAGITDVFEQPRGIHDVMAIGTRNASTDFVVQRLCEWIGAEYKPRAEAKL